MKKLYSIQFDLIKLFCAVLIVYQHVVAGFLINPSATNSTAIIFGSTLNLSRFAVVLFMIISGFLMMKSYENITIKNFYKKKLKKILIMYFSVNLFYSLINYSMGILTVESFFRGILTGDTFYHLWYLNLLLKIYIVFPIIRYITFKISNFSKWIYIIIFMGIGQLMILDNAFVFLYGKESILAKIYLMYLDRSLLYWGFYFILGGVIYKHFREFINFINKYKVFIISVFILDFIYLNYKILNPILIGGEKNYTAGSPASKLIFPFIILSFLFLYYMSNLLIEQKELQVKRFLKNGTRYIFPLYLIHPFVLFILNPLPQTGMLNLDLIIKLILTYGISILLIYYYFKIKNRNKIEIKNIENEEKEIVKTPQ